ncbi:MAG TPA: glycosyltransferase [Spirochaetota bacterium]|nr:glycosyltransferase [Spirochaetota bacterium]HPP03253.1 glycosyltransferase [Spirochaetota bacterium]
MNIYVDCIGISKKALRASFGIYRYVYNLFTGIKRDNSINLNFKIIIIKNDIDSYNFLLDDKRFDIITIDKDIKDNFTYFNVLKNDLSSLIDRESIVFFPRGYFLCNIPNKKILIVHDIIPYYFWKNNRNLKSLFIWNKIKRSINKSDKVIFISSNTFLSILNLYKDKEIFNKVDILYNGVELDNFIYLEKERETKPYFLTFYSKYPHKGYDKVIKAFIKYRENGGKNHLYVIGAKEDGLDPVNNIKYLRYINDIELHKLYRDCSGFISLSQIEGFGYPVIEAAFWGVPVILSSIPVYYETMFYYENSFFTSPYDIDKLSECLFYVENNFKIVNFKNAINEKYSLSFLAKRFYKVVSKI